MGCAAWDGGPRIIRDGIDMIGFKVRPTLLELGSYSDSDTHQLELGSYSDSDTHRLELGSYSDSDTHQLELGSYSDSDTRQLELGSYSDSDTHIGYFNNITYMNKWPEPRIRDRDECIQQTFSIEEHQLNTDNENNGIETGKTMSEEIITEKGKSKESESETLELGSYSDSDTHQLELGSYSDSDTHRLELGSYSDSDTHQLELGSYSDSDTRQLELGSYSDSDTHIGYFNNITYMSIKQFRLIRSKIRVHVQCRVATRGAAPAALSLAPNYGQCSEFGPF
ncbi:hypothetical protein ACJJTC_005831 [Scirpophaga incertulas]